MRCISICFSVLCAFSLCGCSVSWGWLSSWFSESGKEVLEAKGQWSIVALKVGGVEYSLEGGNSPYLVFNGKFQRLSGLVGCNVFSMSYQIDGDFLETHSVDTSDEICYPLALLDRENSVISALSETKLEIIPEDAKVLLQKENFSIMLE